MHAALAKTLKVGDFVASAMELAEVLVAVHSHTEETIEAWMGTVRDDDQILIVRRLEPSRPGSFIYVVATDSTTHVFEEDVRLKLDLEAVETGASTRSAAAIKRYTLKATEKLFS